MPTLYDLLAVALALQQGAVLANPLPVFDGCQQEPRTIYDITYSDPEAIGNGIVGDMHCNGNENGCPLSQTDSFSETVTVTAGIDLNFAEIVSTLGAGLNAGVSIGKTTGIASTAGKSCPVGPWTCALIFTPNVLHVKGTQTTSEEGCDADGNRATSTSPYDVEFPKANADGVFGGGVDICACTDFAHWSDNGAPSIPCPQPCLAH